MQTYAEIAKDYITVWNEKDAARRSELLTAAWRPDATYADPLMAGAGLAEIAGLIGRGTDFVHREGDLIASVIGFLDQETSK
jgi:hypothetical protein